MNLSLSHSFSFFLNDLAPRTLKELYFDLGVSCLL